jgi:hypothetical protein
MAGRLLSLLTEAPRLIVSLPSNSADLARAAADGGADALKVHLRVLHAASGTRFGSLAEERANLEEIVSIGLPTGVVPGTADALPSPDEMRELAAIGIDFFDLFARDMPVWMASLHGLTRVAAIDAGSNLDAVQELQSLGIEMVEAAIVPPQEYGRPLSVADLAAYRRVRRATKLPIIVPTERAIKPEEAPLLVCEAGINALMIGAVVTGREASPLRAATERFASALAAPLA